VDEIYKSDGLKGFFSGVGSSLILIINPIINYVIYEYLKKIFKGYIISPSLFLIIFMQILLIKP